MSTHFYSIDEMYMINSRSHAIVIDLTFQRSFNFLENSVSDILVYKIIKDTEIN